MAFLNKSNSITIGRSIYNPLTKNFTYERLSEKEIEKQNKL